MDVPAREAVDATTTLVLLAAALARDDVRGLAAWLRATRVRPCQLSWEVLPTLLAMFRRSVESALPDVAALRAQAEALVARGQSSGVVTLGLTEARYPPLLAHVTDPPIVLWVRGDAGILDTPAVAVVGARAASVAALDMARTLARELAARGLTIVSGLARGVDGAAHAGALETGRTVAVLGGGADVVYPPEHVGLANRIAETGAVVSEFPPGTPSRRQHFPRRNRIVSGLSAGVVIVEAGEKSGALITAREALDQGREVMVVPGLVASGRNRGGHGLLKDGAALVENADDVLAVLQATNWFSRGRSRRKATEPSRGEITKLTRSDTWRVDGPDPDTPPETWKPGEELQLDDLEALVRCGSPVLLARLLEWELAGLVARTRGGRFVRTSG